MPSITDVNAITNKYIVPKCTDNVFRTSPVLTRLLSRNRIRHEGGTVIQRPITYGMLEAVPYTRGMSFSASQIAYKSTETALTVDMKAYSVPVTIYAWDLIVNRGPLAIFSDIELKLANANRTLARTLSTDMYLNDDGARSARLTGFEKWIDDGSSYPNVGGINRSTDVTVFKSYTASLTEFTNSLLQRAYTQATDGSEMPDLIVCPPAAYDLIWQSVEPSQRYVNSDGDLATIGFTSFRFNAADVVMDWHLKIAREGQSTGYVFGLNSNHIEFYLSTNPLWSFGFTGFIPGQTTLDVTGFHCVACNIVVPAPRYHFKLISTLFA